MIERTVRMLKDRMKNVKNQLRHQEPKENMKLVTMKPKYKIGV